MNASLLRRAAALLLGAAIATPALAAGDAKLGADLFSEHCAECHSLKEGRNKKGPSLFASVGRKAGQIGDFSYSDALKASGITWTPEQLDAYLKAPKQAVPGGKMKYDGMAEAKDRADLIAYLATVR
ncbi:c-type cytochrome [Derxia gummosa]|uniref:C-type cytochrome n=1 Tax=Derxia gummosa DSM 723 TaxID=1121388 RepID=A0A8B6X6E9_9BURK|nr:c-type cytochrome [Derxia gummosa]